MRSSFLSFFEYSNLRYVIGIRIKFSLQEAGIEVVERRKACRGEGDAWKELQIYGEEGYMKIRIGLKRPVAVCSSELRVPMSELKVVVDIECGFRMLHSDCVLSC